MPTLHLSGGAPPTDFNRPRDSWDPRVRGNNAGLTQWDPLQNPRQQQRTFNHFNQMGEARGGGGGGGMGDFGAFLSNLMPSIPGLPGQQANQRQARQYPTEPPPLTPEQIRAFEERRRNAGRQLQEAEAHAEHQRGEIGERFEQFRRRLRREGTQAEGQLRRGLGARGQAYAPRSMGRGIQQIADMEAEGIASAQADKASQMAALDRMVRQAELGRDRTLASIDADKARARADLSRLIQTTGA